MFIFNIPQIILTVALLFGTLVPKRSISSISSRVGIFWGKFFIGSLAGSEPEITIMVNVGRGFRPDSTYMTYF